MLKNEVVLSQAEHQVPLCLCACVMPLGEIYFGDVDTFHCAGFGECTAHKIVDAGGRVALLDIAKDGCMHTSQELGSECCLALPCNLM